MHSNMQITDSIYSSLSGNNLKSKIERLSLDSTDNNLRDSVISALEEALKILRE